MSTFRSKPAIIEAEQFLDPALNVLPLGVTAVVTPACPLCKTEYTDYYVVTIQGERVYVHPGEWIIKEPTGDGYYPCAPDVFEKRWQHIVRADGTWWVPEELEEYKRRNDLEDDPKNPGMLRRRKASKAGREPIGG